MKEWFKQITIPVFLVIIFGVFLIWIVADAASSYEEYEQKAEQVFTLSHYPVVDDNGVEFRVIIDFEDEIEYMRFVVT